MELKYQKQKDSKLFLNVLHNLLTKPPLDNCSVQQILKWTTDGTAFIILDRSKLVESILPVYFRQHGYTSFTKQLNLYNFKSSKDEQGNTIFTNPEFTINSINNVQSKKQLKQIKVDYKQNQTGIEEIQQEHQELKGQLVKLYQSQQRIQAAINLQLQFQSIIFKRTAEAKKYLHSRREYGLKRRKMVNNFITELLNGMSCEIVRNRFVVLNHDLICDCYVKQQSGTCNTVCQGVNSNRSLYQTPLHYPKHPLLQKQDSQLSNIYFDELNNLKPFLSLPIEQQQQFLNNIWES